MSRHKWKVDNAGNDGPRMKVGMGGGIVVVGGQWVVLTTETKGRGAREGGWVLRQRSGTKILDRVRVEGTRETYA